MSSKPESHPSSTILFGPFEFHLGSNELRKHGIRIKLQRQPQQILSLLLKREGALVSRLELQQALWSGSEFGDFEQGLNAGINKLRQSLGDSADQPRYIETHPGQGYRFIAPIHRSPSEPVLELVSPAA